MRNLNSKPEYTPIFSPDSIWQDFNMSVGLYGKIGVTRFPQTNHFASKFTLLQMWAWLLMPHLYLLTPKINKKVRIHKNNYFFFNISQSIALIYRYINKNNIFGWYKRLKMFTAFLAIFQKPGDPIPAQKSTHHDLF